MEQFKEDKRDFVKVVDAISKRVIAESRILLCTNQLAASDLCKRFRMTAKVIVIISNEDGQTLEPEAWIPVAKLQAADKILGFVRFGGYHQFTPVVLGDHPTQGFNEFSMQLSQPA